MERIEELHARLSGAMARIGAANEAAATRAAKLAAALAEEKATNAQLRERIDALTEQHRQEIETLRAEAEAGPTPETLEEQAQALAQLDMDLQRLRMSNDQLRETSAALREASGADAGLINRAMLAEMESLRAARAADAAEAGALLAQLQPLLEQAAKPSSEGS